MMRPVAVEPVKLIFLIEGWEMSVVVIEGASWVRWKRILRTPLGRPADLKTEPMAQKERGESSEPFRMQVLPPARA